MEKLQINTSAREQLVDVTSEVRSVIRKRGWESGLLLLFCPHTTGAVTINEAADPDVAADIKTFLGKLIPKNSGFAHAEGNSDAHIKSSLIGPDLTLIVEDGDLVLGTWQGVYFYEGDGPRKRSLWLKFLSG